MAFSKTLKTNFKNANSFSPLIHQAQVFFLKNKLVSSQSSRNSLHLLARFLNESHSLLKDSHDIRKRNSLISIACLRERLNENHKNNQLEKENDSPFKTSTKQRNFKISIRK